MQERGIECNHDVCVCLVTGPVETGEAYCSGFCKEAAEAGRESGACGCGHPPCDEP